MHSRATGRRSASQMTRKNGQINPSATVRAARCAGSRPQLASGFQGSKKIATIHASSGVIWRMSVKLFTVVFFLTHDLPKELSEDVPVSFTELLVDRPCRLYQIFVGFDALIKYEHVHF